MNSLVIALGNPLREDDGVGWAVASVLQRSKDVRVLVVHQLAPEMAEEVSSHLLDLCLSHFCPVLT